MDKVERWLRECLTSSVARLGLSLKDNHEQLAHTVAENSKQVSQVGFVTIFRLVMQIISKNA